MCRTGGSVALFAKGLSCSSRNPVLMAEHQVDHPALEEVAWGEHLLYWWHSIKSVCSTCLKRASPQLYEEAHSLCLGRWVPSTVLSIPHVPLLLTEQEAWWAGSVQCPSCGTGLPQSLQVGSLPCYPIMKQCSSGTSLLQEVMGILLACRSPGGDVRSFLFMLLCFLSPWVFWQVNACLHSPTGWCEDRVLRVNCWGCHLPLLHFGRSKMVLLTFPWGCGACMLICFFLCFWHPPARHDAGGTVQSA